MKILVIPDKSYTFHYYSDLDGFNKKLQFLKRYFFFKQVTYESLYYSDLSLFDNSGTQIYFLGNLHKEYKKTYIPEYTTNPSAYHSNPHRWLSKQQIYSDINSFDALLISYDNLKDGPNELHEEFKRRNKLIAVLDFPEHEELMINPSEKILYRAGKINVDFHIYFKNIIPKGIQVEHLYPIGPTPIRVENYQLNDLKEFNLRENFLYFSGIISKEETFKNRDFLIRELSNFQKSKFDIIDKQLHYKNKLPSNSDYLQNLSNTKISFSPAGRAWTTTRHFISAIHNCALLIPEPDCELINYVQKDGSNCISYQMIDKMNARQLKKELNSLNEKLSFYENNLDKLEHISKEYKAQVLNNHQTIHRARYIIETIKNYVK